jgi:hypothetical protein
MKVLLPQKKKRNLDPLSLPLVCFQVNLLCSLRLHLLHSVNHACMQEKHWQASFKGRRMPPLPNEPLIYTLSIVVSGYQAHALVGH